MRKTSKDTGDTISVNSGVDNDFRKSDISTKKRNSIKKKVQNFANESDDAALVPLLQTYKDKTEDNIQNSKYAMSTKTDSLTEMDIKKIDKGVEKEAAGPPTVSKKGTLSTIIHGRGKNTDAIVVCNPVAIQNHMNTNVFGNMITSSGVSTPKTSILIEINEKSAGYSSTPLIFTTAKIHTDSKTKTMEPLQVTPVPILSTIEGNLVKSEITSYNDSRTNILPEKFENNKIAPDNLQKTHKEEKIESLATVLTGGGNQMITNKLSQDRFADKVIESKTDSISKPLVNTISITLPSLQQNITIREKINKELVTKSDVVKSMDITTSTQSSKGTTSDDKISSKLKLESTNSMKKLQRQKHTSIEETNNATLSKNEYVHVSKKDSDTKTMKDIDYTPNSNLKTNCTTQSDNTVSIGQTKTVKTCPLSGMSGTDKFTTISKPATTIKPIGITGLIKEPLLKSTLVSTSYIDNKTSMITTKSSTITSVSPENSITDSKVVTKESLHKPSPVSTAVTLTSQVIKSPLISDAKSDNKVKSPSPPSQVRSATEASVNYKGKPSSSSYSDSIASLSSNPKAILSTSINNTSINTPLYIVPTSKTKIGGTPTYNSPGISKTLVEKSADQVTSSVSISTTAVINKDVNSKSEIDKKTLDSKFK